MAKRKAAVTGTIDLLSDKERKRLKELQKKCLDKNGDYIENSEFDDLNELAVLTAKSNATPVEAPVKPEKPNQAAPAAPQGKSHPDIVDRWVKRGYKYIGADKNKVHILYNPEEQQYYRLNRDPNFVDNLGDGLNEDYIKSLK